MAMAWKKLVSSQRKRAVMACFRMVPLYNLPRHRAINLFLKAYSSQWLQKEQPGHRTLIENITVSPVVSKPRPVVPAYKPRPVVPAYKPRPVVPAYKPCPMVPAYKPRPMVPAYKPRPVVPAT